MLVCRAYVLRAQVDHLQWFVCELICFGAVHWCPVPPILLSTRAACMDDEHVASLALQRQAAIDAQGRQVGCQVSASSQALWLQPLA